MKFYTSKHELMRENLNGQVTKAVKRVQVPELDHFGDGHDGGGKIIGMYMKVIGGLGDLQRNKGLSYITKSGMEEVSITPFYEMNERIVQWLRTTMKTSIRYSIRMKVIKVKPGN